MTTRFAFFLGFALTLISINACKKESNSTNITTGSLPTDTVTSFMVNFINTVDSTVDVASYDDPDGNGPINPSIGGVTLKKNSSYRVTFMILDESNPIQMVMLHNKIRTAGKDYKLCMSNPLGVSVTATDSDGSFPIGLDNLMTTGATTGNDYMNFTIKYQAGVKNGQCDPGQVFFTCNLPISIQ